MSWSPVNLENDGKIDGVAPSVAVGKVMGCDPSDTAELALLRGIYDSGGR